MNLDNIQGEPGQNTEETRTKDFGNQDLKQCEQDKIQEDQDKVQGDQDKIQGEPGQNTGGPGQNTGGTRTKRFYILNIRLIQFYF